MNKSFHLLTKKKRFCIKIMSVSTYKIPHILHKYGYMVNRNINFDQEKLFATNQFWTCIFTCDFHVFYVHFQTSFIFLVVFSVFLLFFLLNRTHRIPKKHRYRILYSFSLLKRVKDLDFLSKLMNLWKIWISRKIWRI